MQLSEQQKIAVEHIGSPALVVAGAGAGKTRTLTAKIAYLIKKGFDSRRILAITFTNKAADEMKKRLISMTGLDIKHFPWVRTFHSACYIILQQHCHLAGYKKPLQIFDSYHQQKIIKDIIKMLKLDYKYVGPVRSHISRAKNSSKREKYFDYVTERYPFELYDIYKEYEKILKDNNAVDFDNILVVTRDILAKNKEVREKYRGFFQFILVDEYQDSNDIQEELTGLFLGHNNLFCVGDDWQAVYGFRGSNLDHFLNFTKKYKNASIFKLEENFRSSNNIVKLANNLIDFNANKIDKNCFSSKKDGDIRLLDDFMDENQEAEWIAKKIKILNKKNIDFSQIAVSYRARFCSLAFEKAFRMFNIPYRLIGGKGFFERKEILDILSYLLAAVFPKDDVAFTRIINTPKRGIGPAAIAKINAEKNENMSMQDAARKAADDGKFSTKINNGIKEVIILLDDIKNMDPVAAINGIITRINYKKHLENYAKTTNTDFTSKMENIEQLIFSASEKESLSEFLEEAALIKEDKENDEEKKEQSVSLVTIHSSKGLEFDAVFIAGCEENLLPHWKSLNSEREISEERRLMYVAITRAKKNLYLTAANFRKGRFNERSRFLDEILLNDAI
jgi:DNA helicase II / ATP-dependent DNA helicase PcrA